MAETTKKPTTRKKTSASASATKEIAPETQSNLKGDGNQMFRTMRLRVLPTATGLNAAASMAATQRMAASGAGITRQGVPKGIQAGRGKGYFRSSFFSGFRTLSGPR